MSQRIPRVNQLIKKELSQIILKEIEFSPNFLVTVTRIETSSNLIQAKVFISVIPENRTKNVLEILNQNIYELQQKLNKRMRMRPIPRIFFVAEKETAKAGRIEEILEKLKNN
jgi:ribosome-binding factor A